MKSEVSLKVPGNSAFSLLWPSPHLKHPLCLQWEKEGRFGQAQRCRPVRACTGVTAAPSTCSTAGTAGTVRLECTSASGKLAESFSMWRWIYSLGLFSFILIFPIKKGSKLEFRFEPESCEEMGKIPFSVKFRKSNENAIKVRTKTTFTSVWTGFPS